MRALLGLAALSLLTTAAGTTVELSPQVIMALSFLANGGFLWVFTWRTKKRLEAATGDKTEAETEEIYQRLYQQLGGTHAKLQQDMEVMQADLRAANAKLEVARAERVTIAAERDEIVMRLTMQIEALQEELATTRAQMGLDERRGQ